MSDNVPEHQEFVLKCEAVGFPLPRYEWYKNNVVIPDAKIQSLRFDKISVLDNGEYMCKVTNPMGSVYSHIARIQVNPSNVMIGMILIEIIENIINNLSLFIGLDILDVFVIYFLCV